MYRPDWDLELACDCIRALITISDALFQTLRNSFLEHRIKKIQMEHFRRNGVVMDNIDDNQLQPALKVDELFALYCSFDSHHHQFQRPTTTMADPAYVNPCSYASWNGYYWTSRQSVQVASASGRLSDVMVPSTP